jgi:thermolabile hemolysin
MDLAVASNGPVWLDYLADSMRDVELEDRAYVVLRLMVLWIAGNTINIGMIQQVNDYFASLPANADLSGTLFSVWIGGNDLLALGPSEEIISAAITNINDALQALVFAGAKDILVMKLPDLGLAPAFVNTPLSSAYTSGSIAFNIYLTQLVCDFRGAFPKVKFYMADTFALLQYAVSNGEALGFTNVDGTCVAGGALPSVRGLHFF